MRPSVASVEMTLLVSGQNCLFGAQGFHGFDLCGAAAGEGGGGYGGDGEE